MGQNLEVVVYYDAEDEALLSLIRELHELDVPYEECRISETDGAIQAKLSDAGNGVHISPAVSINGQILVRPTVANVMSAIMHSRSGGFYQ